MKRITIEKVVIGVYFAGIKLSNGCGGISCTPAADLHGPCCSILNMGQKRGALRGVAVYDILTLPPASSLNTVAKIKIGILKNPLEASRQT